MKETNKNKYDMLITPFEGEPYEVTLDTDDIYWSMKQYTRNRAPLTFKILKKHGSS